MTIPADPAPSSTAASSWPNWYGQGEADTLARLFVEACRLDVEAIKPGNVSVAAPGHGMHADHFLRSAETAAPHIAATGLPIGARILRAARATWAAAGCNTNMGILLLCAPLAAAVEGGLERTLDRLDRQDAIDVYEALRLMSPGGLGKAPAHDVADTPQVTLRAAMAAARDRDRIARQYDTLYDDVLQIGLPRLRRSLAAGGSPAQAMTDLFLHYLRSTLDTHVVRKHGEAVALDLRREANTGTRDPSDRAALLAWDHSLKRRGINPGTSADLAVASWFALRLEAAGKTG